ncbi:MAG: hypothetical protein ABF242_06265 [Flavobacteriales bacterium]
MRLLKSFWQKVPQFMKNKWAISFSVLFIWVLFFEDVNLFSLYKTKRKINKLEQEWDFKESRIMQAEEKKALILKDPEKYARETFWMKKSDEELFIIKEPAGSNN